MIKIDRVVVVEGKYDKIRLSNIIDAVIFTTDGFHIFHNKEKMSLLRAAAEKYGLLVITDSDSAGQLIRGHLSKYIKPEYIKNVYLPEIKGKERRKNAPSKEGLLGVEGTDDEIIKDALIKYASKKEKTEKPFENADFYAMGLLGQDGSEALRDAVKQKIGLPKALSNKGFFEAVNLLYDRNEFIALLDEVKKWENQKERK